MTIDGVDVRDMTQAQLHDELIEAGGFYADLYNSQFEDVTA